MFSEKNRIDDIGNPNSFEYLSITSSDGVLVPLSISERCDFDIQRRSANSTCFRSWKTLINLSASDSIRYSFLVDIGLTAYHDDPKIAWHIRKMRYMAKASRKTNFNIRGLRSCLQLHMTNCFQLVLVPLFSRCCWRSLSSTLIYVAPPVCPGDYSQGSSPNRIGTSSTHLLPRCNRSSRLHLLRPPPSSHLSGGLGHRVRSESANALHDNDFHHCLKMTTSSASDLPAT